MSDTMSENVTELAAALSKAQGSIGAAKKDGTNPHFRSTFATLGSVMEAAQEQLYEHGLSYVQLPTHHVDGIGLTTMLMHSSGQWIRSTMVLPIDRQKGRTDVQACGSTLSYMRRYMLMSVLGIPQEDDDGDSSGPRTGDSAPAQRAPRRDSYTAQGSEPVPQRDSRNAGSNKPSDKQRAMFKAICTRLDLQPPEIKDLFERHGHHGQFRDLTGKTAQPILSELSDMQDKANGKGA